MMIGSDVSYAAQLLEKGEVVAIPTETVYGLAGNAFDKMAVAKIFEIKNRPAFNPLIVHIKNFDYIHQIAKNIDERLLRLFKRFSPGPLTILVEKKNVIPDIVTAGSPRVAVRIPNHPLTLKLLSLLDFPLAAPSANPFQYISPTSALQVAEQLGNKIPYILDGGKSTIGIESTIVGIEDNRVVVYRLGGLELEEIEKITGKVEVKTNYKSDENVQTPGQFKKHYAPKKPLLIGKLEELVSRYPDKKIAILTFGNALSYFRNADVCVYNLSETADLREAAARFFEVLYQIDQSDADLIIAELLPDEGLGRAINDKLKRASVE
ncbi:MAG: L-threonylcarbamoyladenylate synthase [Bacteroidia bacterium]